MTLHGVFYGDKRFVIPVYQRPYVWDLERQWGPLWDDIEATVRRLIEARSWAQLKGTPLNDADAKAAPHFLGAIVIEQHPTPIDEPPIRSVVDGQQRLTTLQLLLRGILDALKRGGVSGPPVARIRHLLQNDPETAAGAALHKVWPRPAERTAFVNAMAEAAPSDSVSTFAAARHFFSESAYGFLTDPEIDTEFLGEDEDVQKRGALLVAAIVGLVKLVVIDLEDADDAQVIFEALNARNTPLSATDLVKNLLFMRAQSQGYDPQELYDTIWVRFDRDAAWWREAVGVGHAQRARQDWLLGDWLIAELGRVINVGRLYGEFRAWLDTSKRTPAEALRTVGSYADAYEMLHGRMPGASMAEIEAFRRIEQLNITVATPVLLWLLVQPANSLEAHTRELAFRAIESFVVRRMAVKWQTRGYAAVFADVLKAGRASPSNPGAAIIDALRSGPHGYWWPTNDQLLEAFRTLKYYGPGGINQERIRMLLAAADSHAHKEYHKGEPVTAKYDELQVEHIMPREWRPHWPVITDDPTEQEYRERIRESVINQIGNLTLVSARLNPSMSNAAWETKRTALRENALLRLNATIWLLPVWDESAIAERAEWLATRVAAEWAGPESLVWSSAGKGG